MLQGAVLVLHSEFPWILRGLPQGEFSREAVLAMTALAGLGYAVAMRRVPGHLLPGLALLGATFFNPHVYRQDARCTSAVSCCS